MSENKSNSAHWADQMAERIIREKGDKDLYTCASGITPSGTVHIGNFREIITVELVVRALRERGKNVRFIYSWDDYDVFRKVPKNMKDPELLATYLRKPITLVPDTSGTAENYARANEVRVENILPAVGIYPEYIYQADRYRKILRRRRRLRPSSMNGGRNLWGTTGIQSPYSRHSLIRIQRPSQDGTGNIR